MKRILEILKRGQTVTIEDISEELGQTTESTLARLSVLENKGYIRRIVDLPTGNCTNCSACAKGALANPVQNAPTLWEVIE